VNKMKYMMFGILAFAAVSALGVTIRKDVDYSATVVLENFSGTNNPASAMIRATFSSITNGGDLQLCGQYQRRIYGLQSDGDVLRPRPVQVGAHPHGAQPRLSGCNER